MANYRRPHEEDCCSPGPDHRKKDEFPVTILSCGQGSGLILPISDNLLRAEANQSSTGYLGTPTLVVGTVNLDTRGLDHPAIKIDFSSLINFKANFLPGFELTIIFQLSRSCDHGQKTPLATWIYEKSASVDLDGLVLPREVAVDFQFKDPFSFVWCECHDCPGCCTYLVEIININSFYIESASITNVGITAIASGEPRD